MLNKRINIEWQRLLIDNETCPRCGGTEQELEQAVKELDRLGIKAELEKKELSEAEFKAAPGGSNRILINGQTLEAWLQANTGRSRCCDACGDEECRTVEVSGKVYETIPAELIVRAAKIASERNN